MNIKTKLITLSVILAAFFFSQCEDENRKKLTTANILFLHHSTGSIIYNGGIDPGSGDTIDIPHWMKQYNAANNTGHQVSESAFPKSEPYGWKNYPYDYYNIWVKNAGNEAFMEEPTLEMLCPQYDLIIFKHCFPVSNIHEDEEYPEIDSGERTSANYKLQYRALKEKMKSFPDTKFMVWTGAALTEANTSPENAARARDFFQWVKNDWDEEGDNIFIWDFFELETEAGNYLLEEYAYAPNNPHPTRDFARKIVPLFGQRIIDVVENDGRKTSLTGELK